MTLQEAQKIYYLIMSSSHKELIKMLINRGVRYARIRVDWLLLPIDERIHLEEERTNSHNAFIDACNILARNMGSATEDNSWRKLIGNDRKIIGDFACLLHAILGINAR